MSAARRKTKPTYAAMESRLALLEPIVEALKHHEVDAVIGEKKIAFLLLPEVTEALRDSEAGFRAMFELSGVGMFQADAPAFRFSRVNQTFCEMTGYASGELLAKTYIGLTHAHDHKRDMSALSRVIRGKADAWSIEKRLVRKDGSVIQVRVNGAVVRDDTGKAVRILAMISQIAANKSQRPKSRDKPPGRRS